MQNDFSEGDFKKYIESSRWQFAHTMKFIPHSYTKRMWAGQETDFEKAVMFIRENGVVEKFGKREFTYYYLDGLKYWSMGAPLDETILINRAKVKPKDE